MLKNRLEQNVELMVIVGVMEIMEQNGGRIKVEVAIIGITNHGIIIQGMSFPSRHPGINLDPIVISLGIAIVVVEIIIGVAVAIRIKIRTNKVEVEVAVEVVIVIMDQNHGMQTIIPEIQIIVEGDLIKTVGPPLHPHMLQIIIVKGILAGTVIGRIKKRIQEEDGIPQIIRINQTLIGIKLTGLINIDHHRLIGIIIITINIIKEEVMKMETTLIPVQIFGIHNQTIIGHRNKVEVIMGVVEDGIHQVVVEIIQIRNGTRIDGGKRHGKMINQDGNLRWINDMELII